MKQGYSTVCGSWHQLALCKSKRWCSVRRTTDLLYQVGCASHWVCRLESQKLRPSQCALHIATSVHHRECIGFRPYDPDRRLRGRESCSRECSPPRRPTSVCRIFAWG